MPHYTGKAINWGHFTIPEIPADLLNKLKSDQSGIRAYDASLGGRDVRMANRKIVITTLKKCLAFESDLTCFDVNTTASILAVCVEKTIHVWNLENYNLLNTLGKFGGNTHRGNILSCCINLKGDLIASAGEDKRVSIWSIKDGKVIKIIEGHQGTICQVEFGLDGETIYTASEDGVSKIFEWRTGAVLNSCMRHSFAVKCLDFNYNSPNLVVCGRSDGHMTVWDTNHSLRIDNISPDPDWMHSLEENLIGWVDPSKNHTGAILSVRFSPNGRFLASGSTDCTCKVWIVSSYKKELGLVQRELDQTVKYIEKLNGYIDVTDPTYDEQLKYQEYSALKVGEVPISSGYHADLRHTLRHDAPVLSVRFTTSSEMVVTGSTDSTCRLWSSRRGDLLFQINTPAPVTSIQSDLRDYIYLSSGSRLLVFSIRALFKPHELPNYWKPEEVKATIQEHKVHFKQSIDEISPEAKHILTEINAKPKQPNLNDPHEMHIRGITLNELRRFLGQGLILPSFLDTLLKEYKEIDSQQLYKNMKKYDLSPRQILKIFLNSPFHPKDILEALVSKKNAPVLYSLISNGNPITALMVKLGYQLVTNRDALMLKLDFRDFSPPTKLNGKEGDKHAKERFDYAKWWAGWYNQNAKLQSDDESDEDWDFDEFSSGDEEDSPNEAARPKGKILHFIPSQQIKIIKDLKSSREINPIFLRQLAVETQDGRMFPNFDPNDDIKDSRPIIEAKPANKSGVRFNERVAIKGETGRPQYVKRKPSIRYPQPLVDKNRRKSSLHFLHDSSTTLFKPERYVKTRGVNIEYDTNRKIVGGKGRIGGKVYSTPIIMKSSKNRDDKMQLIIGSPMSQKEATIDDN